MTLYEEGSRRMRIPLRSAMTGGRNVGGCQKARDLKEGELGKIKELGKKKKLKRSSTPVIGPVNKRTLNVDYPGGFFLTRCEKRRRRGKKNQSYWQG